ncbi:hypothetical protein [Amycolatopsis taiwanensis]|uniref:hypothetical protein n=1 Tax=Amycolatopsis taiwanensis TaxID=342230 RepID=UPI0004B76CE6|nr:hypothetical protein [Amycolatopsis taiwanensis]
MRGITYARIWGWAYVVTVIDLCSRAVVGSAIAGHMRTELATAAPPLPSWPTPVTR